MYFLLYITKNSQGPVTSNQLYHYLKNNTRTNFVEILRYICYNFIIGWCKMEIVLKSIENKEVLLNLDKNILFIGKNSLNKTKLLNDLTNVFKGKNKTALINGNKVDTTNYNLINIEEENDFLSEFKFTKNNTLKQMIYKDVIEKINEEKMINYTNEIFDIIDNKVNKLLDRKINKNNDNNLSFQIEVPDINSIIDKFTNIYIDDLLLDDIEITKSMKRKLLYQLYFWEIELNKDKKNIIIIDNFDVYLSPNEIIEILTKINKLSNENCHFILTTSNNIFEYIDTTLFNIYKVNNNIISFNKLEEGIKEYIIKKEFNKTNTNTNYEKFYIENENLITQKEIKDIETKLINKYPSIIGKILNCTTIKFVSSKPKNITSEYIICENKGLQNLFFEISLKFID
jgi:hypothetical protein